MHKSIKTLHKKKSENMKNIIKSEVIDDIDCNSTSINDTKISTNGSGSPCIIRIVPSKKISISTKNGFKTLTVKQAEYLKNIPSTSRLKEGRDCINNKIHETELSNNSKGFDEISRSEIISPPLTEMERINTQTSVVNILKRPAEYSFNAITEKKSKIHGEQCCYTCRIMLEDIQKKQEEILNYFRKGYLFNNRERKLDLLPNMPFEDINDFLDFDESLTHENVQDQFLIKLRKLLVSSEQKSVSNIMSSIMTNELCRGISWIGIKETLAFGSTNMVKLIVDLLQEHHQLEIDVVKARIAEWLRRCGDRIGNEMRKYKKKMSQILVT